MFRHLYDEDHFWLSRSKALGAPYNLYPIGVMKTFHILRRETNDIYMYIYIYWLFKERRTSVVSFLGIQPCDTADMSAVWQRRHVCWVAQQTCLLSRTADTSAVSHSRRVHCVTQQTCLLCHKANMTAVSHRRHVCCVCVTQQAYVRSVGWSIGRLGGCDGQSHGRSVGWSIGRSVGLAIISIYIGRSLIICLSSNMLTYSFT